MIWMIIWAGLFIAVLYSPVGSPDLYTSQNYYVENQNVSTTPGTIQNAPKKGYSSENSSNELDVPQVSSLSKTSYSVGNYPSASTSSRGSSYSVQTQNYQTNNSSGTAGLSGGGNTFIASGSSRNSAGTSGMVMTNGITTLSTTSNLSNQTIKQGANTNITADPPYTDPGEDPFGPPIPVGDGWGLLVLFGVCYAAFKMRVSLLHQLHTHTSKKNE